MSAVPCDFGEPCARPTYHPAYLLRSPNQKKAAWEDLQLAQRVAVGEETS